MRWFVDGWSPGYGASFEAGDGSGPSAKSSATVDPDVEVPSGAWRALMAPADVRAPDVVLLVDGVRRIDAILWTGEDDGASHPGLAASYAAGVVRCDLRRGVAELLGDCCRIGRGLFTASPSATDLEGGQVRYAVHQVRHGSLEQLPAAVQGPLTELEVGVSAKARAAESDLLVVDGPLRNRRQLPGTIGYVKTQQGQYLPRHLAAIVPTLRPGQRTPVFRLGTRWDSHSWYLRLPGAPGAPWSGIVRVECSVDWPVAEAIALADLSVVTLPRFASTAYKDPRAPQNLVPIAGLERRLRGMLGDARLLHRTLTLAAARSAPAVVTASA